METHQSLVKMWQRNALFLTLVVGAYAMLAMGASLGSETMAIGNSDVTLKPPMRSGRQFQKEHLPRDNGRPAQQSSPRRIEGKSVFAWNAGAENRRPGFVYISVDDDFTETGHGYTGEPGEARHAVFGPNLSSGPRFIIRQPDDSGQSYQVNTGPGTTHGRGLYHDHANGAQSPTPFHDGTIQDHYGDYQAEEHHVHHNAEYYREEQDETPTHRLAHENPVYYREEKHETPTPRLAHENPVYYREEKHETPTPRLAHENPVYYREEKHETPTPRLAHENPVYYREEKHETPTPRLAHENPVFYREEQDETHAPRLAHWYRPERLEYIGDQDNENPSSSHVTNGPLRGMPGMGGSDLQEYAYGISPLGEVLRRWIPDHSFDVTDAGYTGKQHYGDPHNVQAPSFTGLAAHGDPHNVQSPSFTGLAAHGDPHNVQAPSFTGLTAHGDPHNVQAPSFTGLAAHGDPHNVQAPSFTGLAAHGDPHNVQSPSFTGLAAHGDPHNVQAPSFTGLTAHGDPHNVQSPSFTGLAAHGDPHNVQAPSFTGLAAHGDPHNVQSPSFTGLAAHGDPHNVQAPSFTGLAAHGDPHNVQAPSFTGLAAHGVQSPSFTGLAAHGDPHNVQSPSFTGLTAHGDPHNVQSPSFTGLTAHGGHTFTGQGPHGDPLAPGAPLTNPQSRSSDHHFHTTTDHQSGKYAGGQQDKQFHRTYPVEPIYSEHHDHHASHGYSHGHSHGSGASYTVPHETHSSHTSGPSKPKSKNDQKTKTEKSAFGNINFICNSFDKRVQVVKSTTRRRRSPAFDVKEEYAEKSSNKLVLLCVANRQDPVKAESEG